MKEPNNNHRDAYEVFLVGIIVLAFCVLALAVFAATSSYVPMQHETPTCCQFDPVYD